MSKNAALEAIVRPAVEAAGFEFWGLEYLSQGKHSVLRVYIDHENGIEIDNCAEVSHQISGVLDVEDPIQGYYDLEVSSPGMDRPLFNETQFASYIGEEIVVKISIPINGRRKFKGIIDSVDAGQMILQVDGEKYELPCQQIDKAHLVANY